LKYNLLAR